ANRRRDCFTHSAETGICLHRMSSHSDNAGMVAEWQGRPHRRTLTTILRQRPPFLPCHLLWHAGTGMASPFCSSSLPVRSPLSDCPIRGVKQPGDNGTQPQCPWVEGG